MSCPICGCNHHDDHDSIPTEFEELGNKLAARILLADDTKRILIPSASEWYGIGLLERDDELPRSKK